jgi:hypothetical protein
MILPVLCNCRDSMLMRHPDTCLGLARTLVRIVCLVRTACDSGVALVDISSKLQASHYRKCEYQNSHYYCEAIFSKPALQGIPSWNGHSLWWSIAKERRREDGGPIGRDWRRAGLGLGPCSVPTGPFMCSGATPLASSVSGGTNSRLP